MPLYTSKEQWDIWVKSVEVPYKHNGKTRYNPGVAGEPKSYPCYCIHSYYSGDCSDDRYECMFIYPKTTTDVGIIWDLETFEKDEFFL
jgi:hypothetical protein